MGTEALTGTAYVNAQSGHSNQALPILALAIEHESTSFRIRQKARKLWDELAAELLAALMTEVDARAKPLNLFETAESLLAEVDIK